MSAQPHLSAELSDAQTASLRESTARVNLWHGSIRSGKTIVSLLRFLIAVRYASHDGVIIVAGRTRESIGRNVFEPLMNPALFGPLARLVKYNAGAPTATILGRTVYVIGANDIQAEAKIRGVTVILAYVDEATVLPEGFFTGLLGRLSPPGAQLFGTTNPDNPAHWLKRRYLDRAAELGWRVFHFTLADNPSLTKTYVDAISAEYTGLYYRRFILGEWVAAEGAIYDMWDPDKHVVAWDALPDMVRIFGTGIDYGTTNASSALMLGLGTDRKLYLIDEWRHDPGLASNRLTDGQLSTSYRKWLKAPHLPNVTSAIPEYTIVDPAAASFKVQLEDDGVRNVINADNDVAYGIRTLATLFGAGQLAVSDRCTGFLSEVTGYSWDPKATEKGEDKPVKVADHSLDAGRYITTTTESLWRPIVGGLPRAA